MTPCSPDAIDARHAHFYSLFRHYFSAADFAVLYRFFIIFVFAYFLSFLMMPVYFLSISLFALFAAFDFFFDTLPFLPFRC